MAVHSWKHVDIEFAQIQEEVSSKIESLKSVTDNKICNQWNVEELIVSKSQTCEVLTWHKVQSSTEWRMLTIQNQQFGIVVEVNMLNFRHIFESI